MRRRRRSLRYQRCDYDNRHAFVMVEALVPVLVLGLALVLLLALVPAAIGPNTSAAPTRIAALAQHQHNYQHTGSIPPREFRLA